MQGQPFLGKYAQKQARQYVFAARDRLDSHYDRVRSVHDGRFQYMRNYYPELPYYMDLTYRRQQASMRDILRWRDAGRLDSVQMRWFLPKGRMEELYDVKADPWQLKNLADDPAYAAVLQRLQAVYANWQQEVPDLGDIDEKSLISRWWNGAAVPPVTSDPLMKRKGKRLQVSCETPGASIGYRIANPGSAATIRLEIYSSPITISDGQRVEVIAHRTGYKTSNVVVHQ
jgi:hypothetical protein